MTNITCGNFQIDGKDIISFKTILTVFVPSDDRTHIPLLAEIEQKISIG